MSQSLKQFERVKRFLRRIEYQNRDQLEYEDDLWAFFQNCWHLKDWVKGDDTLDDSIKKRVGNDIDKILPLRISADLCNRSKHCVLTQKIREDARIGHKNVKIYAGMKTGKTEVAYDYIIVLKDSSKYSALDVARKAVVEWEKLLKGYGLKV